ncbi:MAG TPA: Hsp20/alpha crystallin family protein [Candidatus Blautia merdavium]|uniref:Hsp20/alpha crystallin family protein n=1 Tax=Candidatus Blautia merdavium TaxID=2838494 RepID=A0A9D2PQJ7_9FIRM|nr:Hsp20/alpha crystallin family protein [Candidatus Blautia merdavium]
MMMPSIFGENLFDDFMDFPFEREFFGRKNPLYGKNEKNMMKTDVKELDHAYELDIDLPGFKKEEVTARLENGYLTISAAKGLDKDEKDKEGKYIRRERYAGAMSRSFYVGDEVKQEEIRAKFEDGILRLTVPKQDAQKVEENKYISIEG